MFMTQLFNCARLSVLLGMLLGFNISGHSQDKLFDDTTLLDSLIAQQNFKKADSVLTSRISILKEEKDFLGLTNHIYYVGKVSLKLDGKALAIKKTKDFANSIAEATDSLPILRQKHLVMSRFYVFLRDYKSASEENFLALEITKNIPDATGDLFGLIHHNLSIDYRRLGDIKKAIWHSKKSIDYYLSYPDSDKTKVLDAYNSLGGRMWDSFKIDSALYYFKEGEKIIDELEPTPMNKFYHKAKTQSNISSVYSLLGKSSEALQYNEKAIRNYTQFIHSKEKGNDFFKEEARLFLFMTIENYADDFSKQGNYVKARALLEYVHKEKLKFLPANDTEIAFTRLELGKIHIKLKEYQKAQMYFNKSLAIYTRHKQQDELGIADAYFYKGVITDYYNQIDSTRIFYEKSKDHYDNIFGESYDESYLNAILSYSNFYSKHGYTDKAIAMATKAYNYVVVNQGEATLAEYYQLVNLANIHYESENYGEASKNINTALKFLEDSYSSKTDSINALTIRFKKPEALLLKSKIELQLTQNRDVNVLKHQYKNLKEALSILEEQKTLFTEEENVSIMLHNHDDIFEFSKQIALMLYEATENPTYLKDVLSHHESKLYNRIRNQLNVTSNFASETIPASILEQETQLKSDINSAFAADGNLENFFKANSNWIDFLQTLKHDYPKYYDLKYASISKSLNKLSSRLPDATTIVRYVYINHELYAFVLEKESITVHKIHVEALDQALLRESEFNDFDEKRLESNYKLYTILWQPFSDKITNTHVVIIPDGNLFNLSFEVLTPFQINSFKSLAKHSLLHKHIISYNYSLLLIDKNKTPKFFEDNFIAFTPEFSDTMKSKYKTIITDSLYVDKTYLTLLPQPFIKKLAQASSKVFNGTSFANENASKQVFTKQAKEHKIIHIGTHAESNNISPELSRLIFAKNVNDTLSSEDNSLYTYEIYNQNLASNLAILTACETGKPTFQAGEGMISLAHAFNYAGSESMLTSLWKIDEQSSSKIIKLFYDNISEGLPKDSALQKAKLEYIATAEGRTLAPQYWAGLVLIGDTSPIDLKSSSNSVIYWIAGLILILIIVLLVRKNNASKTVFQ